MASTASTITKNVQKSPAQAIVDTLDVASKRILDIGCGDGQITRFIAKHGGAVTGVDPNPKQIAKILTFESGTETYVMAGGEKLPFDDQSIDIVIYNNSLHHVPEELQSAALEEAERVLKADGTLYIAEPLAEGPSFELSRPFKDETQIRASALRALKKIAQTRMKETSEFFFTKTNAYKDFESYRERAIRIDPKKEVRFIDKADLLRGIFYETGRPCEDGYAFDQPLRVNLMEKR
ncbi:MAG: class I SAM-dependent methyltransferase [Rhodospirillales bacterium]